MKFTRRYNELDSICMVNIHKYNVIYNVEYVILKIDISPELSLKYAISLYH